MKQILIMKLMDLLVREVLKVALAPGNIKACGDKILDFIETLVTDSKNTIDDRAVLPICAAIRKELSLPDDDA